MTAQVSDLIRYKRRLHRLCSEPLEAYFSERKPKPEMFAASCTACWRGYLAIWGIRGGKLYLNRISPWPWPMGATNETAEELCRRSMSGIFPGATAPVFAEWYSGELRLVSGEMLSPNWFGYGGSFEHEIVLLVERGRVIGEKPIATEPAWGYDIPSFLRKEASSPQSVSAPPTRAPDGPSAHRKRAPSLKAVVSSLVACSIGIRPFPNHRPNGSSDTKDETK